MGFLLGAFGKLSAGRRKREIQSQLMRVQSRLRRATRQVSDMDKQLQRAEKLEMNQAKAAALQAKNQALAGLQQTTGLAGFTGTDISGDKSADYQQALMQYNIGSAQITGNFEQYVSFYQQQVSDKYEWLRETQLEPLKQEEEMLQTEQDSLKSQLELAETDYKACQEMEKDGAKSLAPSYTAGGQ